MLIFTFVISTPLCSEHHHCHLSLRLQYQQHSGTIWQDVSRAAMPYLVRLDSDACIVVNDTLNSNKYSLHRVNVRASRLTILVDAQARHYTSW